MTSQAVATEAKNATPTPLVQYVPSDETIATLKTQLANLKADTPAGYEQVRKGIATTRSYRVAIEKRRVELKADALAWGRKVDAEAKRLTELLLEIEQPLLTEKWRKDDEREQKRLAAEEAERAKVAAELNAKMRAEEARLKAIRDAEEAELRVERERLAAERVRMEGERKAAEEAQQAERERIQKELRIEAEQRRKEQAKLEAERKLVEKEQLRLAAEKQRLVRLEFERQAKIAAEKEARERMEQERLEAEKRKEAAARAAEVERLRIEAAKPDVKKIKEFGKILRGLPLPEVTNKIAHDFLAQVKLDLLAIVTSCEEFTVRKKKEI